MQDTKITNVTINSLLMLDSVTLNPTASVQ